MNSFGNNFCITLFGESHGSCVGCVIDGIPSGFSPDFEAIDSDLLRRSPRAAAFSTSRQETDSYEILSGLYRGTTCGTPLAVIFPNKDSRPGDYAFTAPRPSHADLAAFEKYGECCDLRGGGAFSGRLTAPLVLAGAVAKQILSGKGVSIASHICSVLDIADQPFDPVSNELPQLDPMFPLVEASVRRPLEALFDELRASGDSVGAVAECKIVSLPAGIGEPFFDSVESVLSHLLFSIPGVHAVEFGEGFGFGKLRGSQANDPIIPGRRTATNRSGGINGGISNGMPIVFRAAFRPVPSIAVEQDSIDLKSGEAVKLTITGRHDVCILPRGLAAVEAAAAIGILDLLMQDKGRKL